MSFSKKIKEFIVYPWLSIWYAPRKTLKHCLKSNNIFIILLLLLFSVYMNLDDLEFSHLDKDGYILRIIHLVTSFLRMLFNIVFIYFLVKIFKGTISKKEALLVYLLGYVPYLTFSIYVLFAGASDSSLLFAWVVLFLGIIGSVYVTVQMLNEVASLSKWKATAVVFLAFIITNIVIIGIFAYLNYVINPFI